MLNFHDHTNEVNDHMITFKFKTRCVGELHLSFSTSPQQPPFDGGVKLLTISIINLDNPKIICQSVFDSSESFHSYGGGGGV